MIDPKTTLSTELRQTVLRYLAQIDEEEEAVNKRHAADIESLARRRAEAKAVLATLPKAGTSVPRDTKQRAEAAHSRDSISSLIIRAVANKPGSLATDVVASVLAVRPEVDRRTINAILYRLRAVDRRIRHEGERGSMKYFVTADHEKKPHKSDQRKKRASRPYKALARQFVTTTSGPHTVSAVATAIECKNLDQVRNILVRLNNAGEIRRVTEGVYEGVHREAVVPSG